MEDIREIKIESQGKKIKLNSKIGIKESVLRDFHRTKRRSTPLLLGNIEFANILFCPAKSHHKKMFAHALI